MTGRGLASKGTSGLAGETPGWLVLAGLGALMAFGCNTELPLEPHPPGRTLDGGTGDADLVRMSGVRRDPHDCRPNSGDECSLPACGCAADETCAPDSKAGVFSLRCQSFSQRPGEACGAAAGECAPGSICGAEGVCRELCESEDECLAGGSCGWIPLPDSTLEVRVCSADCDPVHPQSPAGDEVACASEEGCDPVERGELRCMEHPGKAVKGAACADDQACQPGLGCVDGSCMKYCAGASDCSDSDLAGVRCVPLQTADPRFAGLRFCSADKASSPPSEPKAGGRMSGADMDSGGAATTGVCTPFDTQCTGVMPQTCDTDGQWQDEQVARDRCGAVCTPGEIECRGAAESTCNDGGRWQAPAVTSGTCGADCTPGDEQCSDTFLLRCNQSGRWDGGFVEAGVCGADCTPDDQVCNGSVLWTCGAAGGWGSPYVEGGVCGAECTPGEESCSTSGVRTWICGNTGAFDAWYIEADSCGAICTPGERACGGTLLYTCSGGVEWVDGVASPDCGAVCSPGEQYCAAGGVLVTCLSNGTWDAGRVSDACETTVESSDPECTPGDVACISADAEYVCVSGFGRCSITSTTQELVLGWCDNSGHWTFGTCVVTCSVGGQVGQACVVDDGSNWCVDGGACPR